MHVVFISMKSKEQNLQISIPLVADCHIFYVLKHVKDRKKERLRERKKEEIFSKEKNCTENIRK